MWSETPGQPLPVDVECYAGYRGEETPRRFGLTRAKIEIAEVVPLRFAHAQARRRFSRVNVIRTFRAMEDGVDAAVQHKAGAFSGKQSRQGNSQTPCSLDSREQSNR